MKTSKRCPYRKTVYPGGTPGGTERRNRTLLPRRIWEDADSFNPGRWLRRDAVNTDRDMLHLKLGHGRALGKT